MKRLSFILPLLALLISGCLPPVVVVVAIYSVVGFVTDLPNPEIYGPLTLQLNTGDIINATPLLFPEGDVYPAGLYDFTLIHSTLNPGESYSVEIINQPNGYTCSFDGENAPSGLYGDIAPPYEFINIICVADVIL